MNCIFLLTWFCFAGHTLILYLYFLSGTGEKREISTIQRQNLFAVDSNTGSFNSKNLHKAEIPSNILTVAAVLKAG